MTDTNKHTINVHPSLVFTRRVAICRTFGVEIEALGALPRSSLLPRVFFPNKISRWTLGGRNWTDILQKKHLISRVYKVSAKSPLGVSYNSTYRVEIFAGKTIDYRPLIEVQKLGFYSDWLRTHLYIVYAQCMYLHDFPPAQHAQLYPNEDKLVHLHWVSSKSNLNHHWMNPEYNLESKILESS